MEQIPIRNPGATNLFVAGVCIPPGETRLFDAATLPPHLRPQAEAEAPATADAGADDALRQMLEHGVKDITAMLAGMSSEELAALAQAEAAGKARKTLLGAITEEQLRRAGQALGGEGGEGGG